MGSAQLTLREHARFASANRVIHSYVPFRQCAGGKVFWNKTGKIFRSIAIGSIGLAAAAWCTAARAETLTVTWTEPSLGISVSWEQSSTAPPFGPGGYISGAFVDVPISDFTSTGTTVVGPYTDIVWVNSSFGGLFHTPEEPVATYIVNGPQAYSGDEFGADLSDGRL